MSHVVVIGAGFGGIAAALRARAKGHSVTVIDRCSRPGGRAQVFERAGFRHDAGPTVITAPFLFEELFALFDLDLHDHVKLVPLKPWYRFEFRDGEHFNYGGSLDDTLAEIQRISPSDVDGYHRLLQASKKLYDIGFTELSDAPFHRFSFMLKQVPHLARLGAWRSVYQMVSRHLKSEHLRQAFSIQPLLVGGNPFDTTSIYALIHFLEQAHGVHFAMGGTGALVQSFADLMASQGIALQLNTTVTKLHSSGRHIHAVDTLDKTGHTQQLKADWVISNADPVHLYRELVPRQDITPLGRLKTRHWRQSMGLFVLFFGSSQQYSDVVHHTIWMGPRYRELLNDIFHRNILAEDFSIYLHRPTATDASFAPPGGDSFYALVPVPNLKADIDWEQAGPRLAERVIDALDGSILPGLKSALVDQFFMTPVDFQQDYLSPEGAGFSISPLFSQSAWFRFHNRGEGPRNLLLTGAGTHPGAGLPGVVCSAKVVDRLLPSSGSKHRALAS